MVAEGGIPPGKVRAIIGRYASTPSKFPKLIDKLYTRYRQHQASADTLASKFPRSFIGSTERRAALAYEVTKHGAVLTNAVFKTKDFDPYYPEVDGALHTLYAQKTANTGWFVKLLSVIKAGAVAVVTTIGSAAVATIITGIVTGSTAIPIVNIIVICAFIVAGAVLLGVGLYYFIRHLKRKYL